MGKMAIFAISPVSGVCPELPKMVHFGPFGGSEPRIWRFGPPKSSILDPFLGGLNPWPPVAPVANDGAARQGEWGLDGPLRTPRRTTVRRGCPRCGCIALWVSKWSKFGPFLGSGPPNLMVLGSKNDPFWVPFWGVWTTPYPGIHGFGGDSHGA